MGNYGVDKALGNYSSGRIESDSVDGEKNEGMLSSCRSSKSLARKYRIVSTGSVEEIRSFAMCYFRIGWHYGRCHGSGEKNKEMVKHCDRILGIIKEGSNDGSDGS